MDYYDFITVKPGEHLCEIAERRTMPTPTDPEAYQVVRLVLAKGPRRGVTACWSRISSALPLGTLGYALLERRERVDERGHTLVFNYCTAWNMATAALQPF